MLYVVKKWRAFRLSIMNYTSMCLVLITVKSCGPIIKFKTNYLIKKIYASITDNINVIWNIFILMEFSLIVIRMWYKYQCLLFFYCWKGFLCSILCCYNESTQPPYDHDHDSPVGKMRLPYLLYRCTFWGRFNCNLD